MANPAVEKIKGLALRLGDKVAVALSALLFLVFLVLALTKPTIDTSPKEISDLASSATSNLGRQQEESVIKEKLDEAGMSPQEFDAKVVALATKKVDPDRVALVRPFVRTEPGAGLIRGDVKEFLLAPYDVFASAGRGGVPFWKRDEGGNLIPAKPDAQKKSAETPGRGGSRGGGGGGTPGPGGFAGGIGGPGGTPKQSDVEKLAAQKKADLKKQQTGKGIVGQTAQAKEEPEKEPEADLSAAQDFESETKGQRYSTVVGLLKHKQLREQLAKALKLDYDQAHPDYVRLDMERQVYDPVLGQWSDWSIVDHEANQKTLEEVAAAEEESEELTLQESRLEPLVGFLPYLAAGYWSGVHHGGVIDQKKLESLEKKNEPPAAAAGGAFDDDSAGLRGGGGGAMFPGGAGMAGMGEGGSEGDFSEGMMMGGRGGRMGGGGYPGMGGGGMMGGSTGSKVEFTSEAEVLMVRALDLTVVPDTIYRYRVRVVVKNPNYNRDDISPGVDNKTEQFSGPWSDPTGAVSVPADVAPYAMAPGRDAGGNTSADQVTFDVVAWNPSTGATVVKSFTTSPGEFVGRAGDAAVPIEGEEKPKNMPVNFSSRQLLFDSMGGLETVESLGLVGPPLEIPAVALLLRPDGSVSVRSQSSDVGDPQRKFSRDTYALATSDQKKNKTQGSMMGMMGGYRMGGGGGMGTGGGGFR